MKRIAIPLSLVDGSSRQFDPQHIKVVGDDQILLGIRPVLSVNAWIVVHRATMAQNIRLSQRLGCLRAQDASSATVAARRRRYAGHRAP